MRMLSSYSVTVNITSAVSRMPAFVTNCPFCHQGRASQNTFGFPSMVKFLLVLQWLFKEEKKPSELRAAFALLPCLKRPAALFYIPKGSQNTL